MQEESKQLEQINQFGEPIGFEPEESDNMLDLSALIDDSFITTTTTATPSTTTTTTTTTTTEIPITTFNWFTSTPSTRRPTTLKSASADFVPSAEGEGFMEITVSGSMGAGTGINKKIQGKDSIAKKKHFILTGFQHQVKSIS